MPDSAHSLAINKVAWVLVGGLAMQKGPWGSSSVDRQYRWGGQGRRGKACKGGPRLQLRAIKLAFFFPQPSSPLRLQEMRIGEFN